MLTNKKRCQKWYYLLLLTAVVAWLAGCTPAGPRALLRGKRLIDQGKYADAVDELKQATSLLPTNAIAWDYLGLAYHHAGQPANAIDAYQRALKLNHDLVVVHYVEFDPKPCYQPSGKREYCGPQDFGRTATQVYHNLGGGRFEDATEKVGLNARRGPGLGILTGDFGGHHRAPGRRWFVQVW